MLLLCFIIIIICFCWLNVNKFCVVAFSYFIYNPFILFFAFLIFYVSCKKKVSFTYKSEENLVGLFDVARARIYSHDPFPAN